MAIKVPNVGEIELLNAIRSHWNVPNCYVDLFTNDRTPGDADTLTDYTKPVWTGYTTETLDSWTAAATNANGEAEIAHGQKSFDNASDPAVNVYGYYVHTTIAGGVLLFAERHPNAPFSVVAGSPFVLDLRFVLKSIS